MRRLLGLVVAIMLVCGIVYVGLSSPADIELSVPIDEWSVGA